VRRRTALKQRVHSTLIAHGKPCPVADLFGHAGRELLERLEIPEPWRTTLEASIRLIDILGEEITAQERELRRLGADHRYVPLLTTIPGIAWVLGFTIACEIGDIERFASARKLGGYTGLCPKVDQSGERDRRGPPNKNGPRYLRRAPIEAAQHAGRSEPHHDLASAGGGPGCSQENPACSPTGASSAPTADQKSPVTGDCHAGI
jgi:transposase